jgi:hypothetical protein
VETATCTLTLWHAAGVGVPAKLVAALGKQHGVKLTQVGDPFMALAEICSAARVARQSGVESNSRLIILFPELLTDAAEFCAVADLYAPGVPRWQYGPATNPQLRPIVDEDVMSWSSRHAGPEVPEVVIKSDAIRAAGVARGAPPPKPGPQLRLAGEGPAEVDNRADPTDEKDAAGLAGPFPDADPSPPPLERTSSSQLITDEELRMLLGESNDEGKANEP